MADDTIDTVRLIGIDTPETKDPQKSVQCFGQEASSKATELLQGQIISIEKDSSQDERDNYDRLLAYIFLKDGTNVNKLMIEQGFAYEYTYDKPYKYQQDFKKAQQLAMENKRGLWADDTCGGQLTGLSPTPTIPEPTVIEYVEPTSTAMSVVPTSGVVANTPVPTNAPVSTSTPVPPTPKPTEIPSSQFSCEIEKTCSQMASCEEAYYHLNVCDYIQRDGDKDGVPCESICPGG